MSLFSAITHEGSVTRPISRNGILALVLGATVAIAAALALVNDSRSVPSDSATAVVTNWQASRFNEVNITGLEFPASAAAVEPFRYWNTTALETLIPAASVAGSTVDSFISWNTTALEYPNSRYSERWNGPR